MDWAASLLLAACNFQAGVTYDLRGTVVEVRERAVVIDHEAIPGFMDAMTMAFAAEPTLLRGVTAGDVVEGRLIVSERGSRLAGLEVVGRAATPATSLPPAAIAVGEVLPAWTVQTAQGPLALGQGAGQVTVLTFLFTTCPADEYCPLLARKLAELQPQVAGRARIVAITLDPARDTFEVLTAYGAQYAADPATWVFGRLEPEAALRELLVQAGVNRLPQQGTLVHNLKLLVLDSTGRVVFRADDNTWTADAVLAAVATASTPTP